MICTLDEISHRYKSSQGFLFSSVKLEIDKGKVFQLKGNNGSGKTTLLKIVSGLLKPEKGSVILGCTPQEVGLLLTKSGVHPRWTVEGSLQFWARQMGLPQENIEVVVKLLELTSHLHDEVGQLSSGWVRRLGFARVFMKQRKLYLLDEIGHFLDQSTKSKILNYLEVRVRDGASVVFTSHDEEAFFEYATWEIKDGQLQC